MIPEPGFYLGGCATRGFDPRTNRFGSQKFWAFWALARPHSGANLGWGRAKRKKKRKKRKKACFTVPLECRVIRVGWGRGLGYIRVAGREREGRRRKEKRKKGKRELFDFIWTGAAER